MNDRRQVVVWIALALALTGPGCSGQRREGTEASERVAAVAQAQSGPTCVSLQRGTGAAVADAEISSGKPDKPRGGAHAAHAGVQGGDTQQVLLRFDLSGIPANAMVTSATLTLAEKQSSGGTLRAHRITGAWSEPTVTWNGFGGQLEASVAAASEFGGAAGLLAMDWTALAAEWVGAPLLNHGVLLERTDGETLFETSESPHVARQPRLDVCFEAPQTPSGTSLYLQVFNTAGVPVPIAAVTTAGGVLPTNGAGQVLFEGLAPGRFAARVEAPGFAPASVVADLPPGAHAGAEVRLIPAGPPIPFNAAAGAALQQGGVRVTIPAGGLVDPFGQPVTGTVEATVVPLDPTTASPDTLPAPLEGVAAGGQAVFLESVAMAEVSLWQGGIPLQLAPGVSAALELQIPDALAGNYQIGDTIPAWWLDLDGGAWRQEGAGTVQSSTTAPGKLAWFANVGHFTWWNADVPLNERSCFAVQVLDSNGAPVPDVAVSAVGQSFTGTSTPTYTGGSGQACVEIPLGGTARIFAGPIEAPFAAPVTVTGAQASDCTGQAGACAPLTITIPAGSIVCTPGENIACPYTGPAGTDGVGLCQAGTNYCSASGTSWIGCDGEVTPGDETCYTAFDDDCDGQANEEGSGCACAPGSTIFCYSGPASTEGVGMCHVGQQACSLSGLQYGPCTGEVVPQPETCATPGDDDCDGSTDCSGSLIWSFSAGSPANQGGTDVVVDGAGGVLFAGITTSAFDLGGGPLPYTNHFDTFLTKRNAGGDHVWSKAYGGGNGQYIWRAATDGAQNAFVCGWFYATINFGGELLVNPGESDVFIAKLDPQGNRLWSKSFGDGDLQLGLGLTVDGAGNAIVAGPFRSSINLGGSTLVSAGGYDVFVAKFDPAGNHLWSARYGQASDDGAEDVAADGAGNVIVTGYAGGSVHYNSGPTTAYGVEDVLVWKLDAGGNELWSARFGDASSQIGKQVEVDSTGAVLVSGGFSGALDFGGGALVSAGSASAFLAKLDAAGNHLWSKQFANATQHLPIAIDSADRIFVTGGFSGTMSFGGAALTSAGNVDLFVAKLDPAGNHLWSKRFGDAAFQSGDSAHVDSAGDVVVAGSFGGTLDFPGGPVTSAGSDDVFLVKLAP